MMLLTDKNGNYSIIIINNLYYSSILSDPFNGIVPASSLCQVEHSPAFQSKERRIDTSLSLELKPNSFTGPCKQLFEAPPSHGLYVRVHPISLVEKNKHEYSTSAGSPKNMNIGGHQMMRNESCPIHIVSRWEGIVGGFKYVFVR